MPGSAAETSLKRALLEMVSESQILRASLWVDGIYTPMIEEYIEGRWINGREVYFRVEGKIEAQKSLRPK